MHIDHCKNKARKTAINNKKKRVENMILDIINKKAESKNWRLMAIKETNNKNIFISLNEIPEKKEFATHIYNIADDAFYNGGYFASHEDAIADYNKRA